MTIATFQFLDVDRLVDRELELVPPSHRWIDDCLQASQHPRTVREDPEQAYTRHQLERLIAAFPDGRRAGDPARSLVPQYEFWMRLRPAYHPPVPMAGSVSFRVSNTPEVELYFGHIGYGVFPPARGQHYAERATRLLFPLARAHGMSELWITCNPDNLPSRRTCERLGGQLVEIIAVPPDSILYLRGERHKCRYRVDLGA